MQFGLFFELSVPRPFADGVERAVYERSLEQVRLADALGFDTVWAVEHHFLEEYSHCSAPELFLTACAVQTTRIRVGHGAVVCVPAMNHPVRVAERAAVLDILSGGRLELGTARSSTWTELGGFSVNPDDTKKTWDEFVRVLPQMWTKDEFEWQGKAFSMPSRNVLPKPYSKPHPPLWVACGSPSTFEKAGRLGLGALCFSLGTPKDFEPLIRVYKDNIKHAEPVGEYVNDNVACVTQMVCLEDGKRARQVALTMGSGYHTSLVFRYLDTFPRPAGVPAWPQLIPEPTPAQLDERIATGQRIVGNPDECAKAVQQYADVGCDQIIFGVLASTQPQATALETVRTFGAEVQPRFDKDPVHSTTRYREAAVKKSGGAARAAG